MDRRSVIDKVGQSVLIGVVMPFSFMFALGAGTISFGSALPGDWIPARAFFIVFGLGLGATGLLAMIVDCRVQVDRANAEIDHALARTDALRPPLVVPAVLPPVPQVIEIHSTVRTDGGSQTKIKQYAPEQIPPREFLEWLFTGAGASGRVPGERMIFDRWTASANAWLAVLEDQDLIEKVGDHPNAPRRICDGVTPVIAYARFGYLVPALAGEMDAETHESERD